MLTAIGGYLNIYQAYSNRLKEAFTTNPQNFRKSFEHTYKVMSEAFIGGQFHISETIKQACKDIGIKPTFKAIKENAIGTSKGT